MDVSARFRNFWPGFDPQDFFVPMLEGIAPGLNVRELQEGPVDIEFVSSVVPWPSRPRRVADKIRRELNQRKLPVSLPPVPAQPLADATVSIWFTGENIRPPLLARGWDLTLSFDPDSEVSGNLCLPQWWFLLPELLEPVQRTRSAENRLGRELTIAELMAARPSQVSEREGFACTIFHNPEPKRLEAIRALQTIGQVDVFGTYGGKVVPTKEEVLRNYRFCICFENDVYPGYVTEKVFDAWAGGCIPIWNGLDNQSFVNGQAVINLAECAGMDGLVARVNELNTDARAMNTMSSLPILLREPSLAKIRERLGELLHVKGVI